MLLVWAWTGVDCSWEMPGHSLVDPPPSPALRRSWGKVLVCHKGLGGVFCVSGPDVCQPKGLVYQLENLWMQLALSVIPGWTTPSGAVSHSSTLLGLISSPSCPRVVPHLVCVLFPYPIHLPPSCSPSLPIFFFVPSHPLGFPLRVPSHFSLSFHPLMHCLFLRD